MTHDFRAMAIEAGLRKLLKQGYFSICQFDELAKAANLTVPGKTREEFTVLHCVHYSDMPPELHAQVVERVTQMFAFALPVRQVETKVAPEKTPNLFIRLLKGESR